VEVSEVFHDVGGIFHHADEDGRVPGPAPDHQSYASFASFSDPDGNGWVLQEITTTSRLMSPGCTAGVPPVFDVVVWELLMVLSSDCAIG
jgi:hypothetical protein